VRSTLEGCIARRPLAGDRHSSRSLPLKLSSAPFCKGLSGSLRPWRHAIGRSFRGWRGLTTGAHLVDPKPFGPSRPAKELGTYEYPPLCILEIKFSINAWPSSVSMNSLGVLPPSAGIGRTRNASVHRSASKPSGLMPSTRLPMRWCRWSVTSGRRWGARVLPMGNRAALDRIE
jgi:hypothetical protein